MAEGLKKPSNVLKFNPITNELERAVINLISRNGDYIGTIQYENLEASLIGNGTDEISFDIRKEIDGEINPLWDKFQGLKVIEYVGYGRFEAKFTIKDDEATIKTATCKSLENELGQQYLHEFHVNDEVDIASDNYKPTYIYDEDDVSHSLLNRAIKDKAPQWSIGHVDELVCVNKKVYPINTYQRTFTVDGKSIYDFLTQDICEECNCIITFDTINRTINLYNIKDYIYNLSTMEIVEGSYECDGVYYDSTGNVLSDSDYGYCSGIGKDTMIYIDKSQLANSFSIDEDTDSMKNCFYIKGGDDTINGFIPAATMTGNNYIYLFDKFQKDDMPQALSSALDSYNTFYNNSKASYSGAGGVYVYDSTCHYDSATKTCRNANNKILTDAVHNSGKVYALDTCAYYNNNKAYTRDDIQLATGNYYYSSDGGIYTHYCHVLDRVDYLTNTKFPNVTNVETTATDVANSIVTYFGNTANKVYVKLSWTTNSFTNVTSTVETMLCVKCDSRYEVKVNKSSTSPTCTVNSNTGTWSGNITVTSKTDETDNYSKDITVNIVKIDDTVASQLDLFNRQKLDIAISKLDIADLDLSSYTTTSQLIAYFKQYNKTSLDSFCKCFDSCLSTLTDLYSSNSELSDVYSQLKTKYTSYYDSCRTVFDNISAEINILNSQSDDLYNQIIAFQKTMSLETYLNDIDETLYPIFRSFVREDEYSNSNYVSDGLSDSECLTKAHELVRIAEDNLKDACVVQKKVSGDLCNLFSQNDFNSIKNDFALYNYIRCRIDDKIYKLRLIEISFSDSDLTKLNVTFSEDVIDVTGNADDIRNILSQVSSISTSYQSTVQQAQQGTTAMAEFDRIRKEGLSSADYVIANSDDEEVVQDRNGILLRSMTDVGCYGDHQMRINGNGIYLTDSSWEDLVRMAIGLVKINGNWQYGVIADSIVGKLLLGEKAVIGNSSGTVTIDGDGIELDGGAITWKSPINQSAVDGLEQYIIDADKAIDDAQKAADDAQKDANKANGLIDDITSDSKLTPSEKQNLDITMKEIVNEKAGILSQANTYGVDTTNYTNAYNTLYNYCYSSTGVLYDLTTTSDITSNTMKTNFSNYYKERQNVLDSVTTEAKSYAELMETNSNDYADKVVASLGTELTTQIDGKIDTWNQTTDPSSSWTTDDKTKHKGDIWYNGSVTKIWGGSSWTTTTDTVLKGIADSKKQVFTTTPTVPYYVGDLWVTSTTNSGEIKICKMPKTSGTASPTDIASDWVASLKYTDDSALTTFINGTYKNNLSEINSSIDKKAETWYQSSDPSSAWTTATLKDAHVNDLWFNTSKSKSYMYYKSGSTYSWKEIDGVPDGVYDKIDGKKAIYTSSPSTYSINDMYILETARGSWKSGSILIATTSRTTASTTFTASHWKESVRYTDDTNLDLYKTEINAFKNRVNTALMGSATTEIGSDYVISPKIGGGYLYISKDNCSVEIDPARAYLHHNSNIIKVVSNNSDIFHVDRNGNGYFKGDIHATSGTFSGQLKANSFMFNIKDTTEYNNIRSYIQLNSPNQTMHDGDAHPEPFEATMNNLIDYAHILLNNKQGDVTLQTCISGDEIYINKNYDNGIIKTAHFFADKISIPGEIFADAMFVQGKKVIVNDSDGNYREPILGFRSATDNSCMEIVVSNGQGTYVRGVNWYVSDTRLKENIEKTSVQNVLEKIDNIDFIQFDWKENKNHVDFGMSANQVEEILPEAVFRVEQPEDNEYDFIRQLDTGKLVTYALKGIQELNETIKQQQLEINDLKNEIKLLKQK